MIIVSVQLLSAIDGRSEELARMEICNMGTGTVHKGNYSAETLRGRSTADFARRTRQRIAYVNDHPRQREHVWNLVAKCLRALRYGGDWKVGSDDLQIAIATPDPLRKACAGIADDYMTSDRHHPGYVLIPEAKFREICAALARLDGAVA